MQMMNRQFLTLTPGYKYRNKSKNNIPRNKTTTSHNHRKGSLLAYRAYDKQDLLQNIGNKLQEQIKAQQENRVLKQQMNKAPNWNGQDKMWSSGQIQMMMVSIQEENHQLGISLEQKKKDIEKLKKSAQYCQFRQTEISYTRLNQELSRLKEIVKDRKRKKVQLRRTYTKSVNEQLILIVDKERDIREISNHNQKLKAYLSELQEDLDQYKNKNKQLLKNKKKLIDDINLKMSHTQKQHNEKLSKDFFKIAIKRKSSKPASPATIMEVQQQSEMSPKDIKCESQSQNEDQAQNIEESSNSQTQSAQSQPESMFRDKKLNDSF